MAAMSVILPSSAAEASARRGGLDLSFGANGKVTTDFAGTGNADTAQAVVVQPNGRIVVAGTAGAPDDRGVVDFGLVGYLPNGSLDPSFGTGGKVTTDLGGNDGIQAMVALPDGRMLVAGLAFRDGQPGSDFALARYRRDGSLDRTFGSQGLVWTDFGYEDVAHALVLQPDGKVVVGGEVDHRSRPPVTDWALARYNPDGSLDRSFGSGGQVTTSLPVPTTGVHALVLQPDGKLVGADENRLMRFNRDGTVDTSFGDNGKVLVNYSDEGWSKTTSLAIQGNKLIAAGAVDYFNNSLFALARFDRDGSLDRSFGRSGVVLTKVGTANGIHAVVVRGNKLIAGGSTEIDITGDFAVAIYNRNGSLDCRFGNNGTLTTDFNTRYDGINALAFQPDGRLIAAGAAYPAESTESADFAVARYRIN